MDKLKIPNHVAIIMDGNGRWAKEKGKSRTYGHLKGADNLKKLAKHIFSRGVKILSVYAFSTENFNRSEEEVNFLINLFLNRFAELTKIKDTKIVFSGIMDKPLPEEIIKLINKIENDTKNQTKYTINICINYGGQSEIVDACKKICQDVENKAITINDISIDMFPKYLYKDLPPIDFLIRTSGELRISNFMLWQLSYAELYFPKTYFPDFDNEEFDQALLVYNKRDRRFGTIKEKL